MTALTDTSATQADATNAKGDYLFDLTQAETNGDKLRFTGKSSTANVEIIPQTIYTTPAGFTSLTVTNIWAQAIESGATALQTMRAIGAMLAGIVSGGGSGTEVFKGIGEAGGGTTRVTVTADSSGNRSGVTLNL